VELIQLFQHYIKLVVEVVWMQVLELVRPGGSGGGGGNYNAQVEQEIHLLLVHHKEMLVDWWTRSRCMQVVVEVVLLL
jgi:hypothetical protein